MGKNIVVFRDKVLDLSQRAVTDREAQALLAKTLYDGTITFQTFKVAYDLYFERGVKFSGSVSRLRSAYSLGPS